MIIAVAGAIALSEWTEAASVVFLFALAQMLESRAMDRARGAIRALMDLAPVEAIVLRDGQHDRIPVDDVRVGDTILVGPGEKVPLDGRVLAGDSYVNQAPVTGESLPIEKTAGDDVFAGTINGRGALDVVVTRLRRDSATSTPLDSRRTSMSGRTSAVAGAFVSGYWRNSPTDGLPTCRIIRC